MFALFDNSTEEEIAEFAEMFHFTFPVGKENGIARAVDATGLPAVIVLIARNGEVTRVSAGQISAAALSASIEEIL
jgi:hypothetical protein